MAVNGTDATLAAVRKDLEAIGGTVADLLKNLTKLPKEGIDEAADEIGGEVQKLRKRIDKTVHRISDTAEKQAGAARGYLQEHPLTTIAGAFATGLILARLVK